MQIPAEGAPGDYGIRSLHSSGGERHIEVPMSMRDHYRTRAAEFHARAQNESDETVRREYKNLAKQFLHLAEEANRDATVKQVQA